MTIPVVAVRDALVSHLLASGLFAQVNSHEPKSAPSGECTAAVWLDATAPAPGASGLSMTTVRLSWKIRVYQSMLLEPQDEIDTDVMAAVDHIMGVVSGDFELGGLVRSVDLLGAHGQPLSGQAGYLNQSGKWLRIFDIIVPLIVNDVWTQAP